MKTPRWSSLAGLRRSIRQPFAIALFLSAIFHFSVFASVLAALSQEKSKTTTSMPILVVAYGDSDRLGLPVAGVAPDPGTVRPGDADTPGGDGKTTPAVEKAPAPPTPAPAPAPVPAPEKPTPTPVPVSVVEKPMPAPFQAEVQPRPPTTPSVVAALGKPDTHPSIDRPPSETAPRVSNDSGSPGAPGGSRLSPGTPSAGGKSVGSTTGVRMASGAKPPDYPTAAREAELEGTPVVWLRVSAEGDVLEARIQKTCGHKILDDAALQWARAQKFLPALRDGQPVEAEVTKPVRFFLY